MRAYRKRLKVAQDRGVNLGKVPFEPGTKVEVIVVPAGEPEPPIYRRLASATRRRKIPRYTMKEIERIVHEVRGIRD